jgi:hypothetical protein
MNCRRPNFIALSSILFLYGLALGKAGFSDKTFRDQLAARSRKSTNVMALIGNATKGARERQGCGQTPSSQEKYHWNAG